MVGFYADEGVEHTWPDDIKLGGGADASISDTENCSRFRDCTTVQYEIMFDNRILGFVTFEGLNIALGKGVGTWECSTSGQTPFKGKFATEEKVEGILKGLVKKLQKFNLKARQDLIRKIRLPPGWYLNEDDNEPDLGAEFAFQKEVPSPGVDKSYDEKVQSSEYVILATFFGPMHVASGEGRWDDNYFLSFNSYGGLGRHEFFKDEGSYKNIDDIAKLIKAFEGRVKKWWDGRVRDEKKQYEEYEKQYGHPPDVRGTTMKRATAVALTRKAMRTIKAKHVGEIYPKVACQIMDESIVFVTTRSHLWAGVDPSIAKSHIDEAAKAVTAAAESFLKAAKKAGDEGMTLVRNRKMGGGGLNSTKYPGLVQAYYVWSFPSGLDDALKAKAEEIAKSAKLEPNVKVTWN